VGGHLRAGDPGVRLIEPRADGLRWLDTVPGPFAPPSGRWLVVPLHHLFGSEETSALAAPLQARMPQPYAALATAEAQRLGLEDGVLLGVRIAGLSLQLPLRIDPQLSLGLLGLPVGLPGITAVLFGQFAEALQECST